MNVVGLRQAKSKLSEVGRQAQRGKRLLVTRRGKPFFVIVGVEGEDLVDVLLRWDPEFWRDIENRRKRSAKNSVSLDEFDGPRPRPRRRSGRK